MRHQVEHVQWMTEGFHRHGVETETVGFDEPVDGDICVIWGWKQHRCIARAAQTGSAVLVMERGHLQPRMQFASLGWNGLGGRGRYPLVPGRWRKHWGEMAEWHQGGEYILVMGQVSGDVAVGNVDFNQWAQDVTDYFVARGENVAYRPHPVVVQRNCDNFLPNGATRRANSLDDDLARAKCCVIWSSTSSVEAVLAGVPTITFDRGAMAWEVSSHDLSEPLRRPDRSKWVEKLASCQWNEAEIRSGEAWAALSTCMEAMNGDFMDH